MEINSENGSRNDRGQFVEGHPNVSPGRPVDTPEVKMVRRAIKEIVADYKQNLADALPQIEPVLIDKAIKGDMVAVKEIHDRVMGKPLQRIGNPDGSNLVPIPLLTNLKDVPNNNGDQENSDIKE